MSRGQVLKFLFSLALVRHPDTHCTAITHHYVWSEKTQEDLVTFCQHLKGCHRVEGTDEICILRGQNEAIWVECTGRQIYTQYKELFSNNHSEGSGQSPGLQITVFPIYLHLYNVASLELAAKVIFLSVCLQPVWIQSDSSRGEFRPKILSSHLSRPLPSRALWALAVLPLRVRCKLASYGKGQKAQGKPGRLEEVVNVGLGVESTGRVTTEVQGAGLSRYIPRNQSAPRSEVKAILGPGLRDRGRTKRRSCQKK